MTYSDNAIKLIKKWEGCELKSYQCSAGRWTIGYGNTKWMDGSDVKQGEKITLENAEKLLKHHLDKMVISLNRLSIDVSQNQFDAIVSLVYNIGLYAFRNSTLLKMIKVNPNGVGITKEWQRWCTSKGKVILGLQRRRKDEVAFYFST
jgi:lysozyme